MTSDVLLADSVIDLSRLRIARDAIESLKTADDVWLQQAGARFERTLNTPLAEALADSSLDRAALSQHLNNVSELFANVANSIRHTLARELYALPPVGMSRNGRIVLARLGYMSSGRQNLEAIARIHGVTRERIRQIFEKFERQARQIAPPLPLISTCVEIVRTSDKLLTLTEWWGHIPQVIRPESELELEGIVSLAEYGWIEPVYLLTISNVRFAHKYQTPSPEITARVTVMRLLMKEISWIGLINPETYSERAGLDVAEVQSALELIPAADALHASNGWFAIAGSGAPLAERVAKMLTELGALPITSIRDGLRRDRRFLARCRSIGLPPSVVLLRQLERLGFSVDQLTNVVTLNAETRKVHASGAEGEILAWLKRYQPATRGEITAALVEKGYSHVMASVVIGQSSLLERHAAGIYGIRGVRPTLLALRDVLRRQSKEESASLLPSAARRRPGKVTLEYDLTSYVKGATVYIPSGSIPRGTWHYRGARTQREYKVRQTYVTGLARDFGRALDTGFTRAKVTFWLAERWLRVVGY
jgi:hypothetical protein